MSVSASARSVAGSACAEYRYALGRFPTGVAFAAAKAANGEVAGLLISSFTSVSLSPPLIGWCLDAESRSHRVFSNAPTFAISVLSEDQKALLNSLRRPFEERLEGLPLLDGLEGAPVLQGAAAVFECRTFSINRAGDHDLFLGLVEKFDAGSEAPLAYLSGQFGRVHIHG